MRTKLTDEQQIELLRDALADLLVWRGYTATLDSKEWRKARQAYNKTCAPEFYAKAQGIAVQGDNRTPDELRLELYAKHGKMRP